MQEHSAPAPEERADSPRPAFALPFSCGDVWELRSRANHNPQWGKIDFHRPEGGTLGSPVLASAAGRVTELDEKMGGVELAHGNNWYTLYLHMKPVVVRKNQRVGKGQVIGYVGNVGVTGSGKLPHLHYEQGHGRGEAGDVDFDGGESADRRRPVLQGVAVRLDGDSPVMPSTNTCPGGGSPSGLAEMPKMRGITQLHLFVRRYGDDALVHRWLEKSWAQEQMRDTRLADKPAVAAFLDGISVVSREHDNRVSEWRYTVDGGWHKAYLQGFLLSPPVILYWPRDRNLHAVGRGTDSRLWHWWSAGNGQWSKPELVDPSAHLAGTPALAVHRHALHIIARTTDDKVRDWMYAHTKWERGDLPGAATASPATVTYDGELWVYARGTDGHLWRWRSGEDRELGSVQPKWRSARLMDGSVDLGNAPAATVYRDQVHVVARTTDNAIHHWWGRKTTWQHERLPGAFTAAPSISAFGDQLHIAGRGTDGKLYTVWYDGKWNTTSHQVPTPGERPYPAASFTIRSATRPAPRGSKRIV
ncbi:peptidoglycan DD-metalloendopeptidase family protein [Paractinoplanes deccanensis]|nr:peptidoglycan DD-metalloendopeptidase family protein [Actinoplanes deccanensis]